VLRPRSIGDGHVSDLGGRAFDITQSYLQSVYLNLPVCIVAWILIMLSLRNVSFGPVKSATWQDLALHFDFIGLYVP